MTAEALPLTMGAEFLRLIDAKDETAIVRLLAEDAQLVDETTRRWVRGREAIGATLRDQLSRIADMQSSATDVHVERWGDVEVETFILHQVYDLDDAPCYETSPTTLVWRRIDRTWRLAIIDAVPTIG